MVFLGGNSMRFWCPEIRLLISENYSDWSRPGESVPLVLDPGICFVNLLLKTVWYKCAKRASFGWVLALLVINLQHNLIRWEIAKMFLTFRMFKKCFSGSRILRSRFFSGLDWLSYEYQSSFCVQWLEFNKTCSPLILTLRMCRQVVENARQIMFYVGHLLWYRQSCNSRLLRLHEKKFLKRFKSALLIPWILKDNHFP